MNKKLKFLPFSFHPFLFAIFPAVAIFSENLNLLLPNDIIFLSSMLYDLIFKETTYKEHLVLLLEDLF